ncbi:START domain-containing protein [Chloropicon primus]|nr:START domain-containing protein [Chloropicon primus]
MRVTTTRGPGVARSQSGVSVVTTMSEGVKEGIVVVWPYAVVLTAVAGMYYGQVIWFMVEQLAASPTESAAAALFAVFVAFRSGFHGLPARGEAGGAGGKRRGSFELEAPSPPGDAYAYLTEAGGNLAASLDNLKDTAEFVMDQMRYTNSYINQQYAESLQYLQSQYLSQQVVLEKLNSLSQYYCSEQQQQEEAGGEAQALLLDDDREARWGDEAREREAVVRHKGLHSSFVSCLSDVQGDGGLPDFEAVSSLFRSAGDPTTTTATTTAAASPPTWSKILTKETETMEYSAWSMPLRRGFNVYRTETVFRDATAGEFIRFMTDDAFRRKWDENSTVWDAERGACVREGLAEGRDETRIRDLYCRMKIPPPFRARQYFLQRSLWANSETGDGEIIISTRPPAEAAGEADRGIGNVTVDDYLSLCSARTLPAADGEGGSSVKVTFMYFEDTKLPSQLVNQIVKCRMGKTLAKTEEAMRSYIRRARSSKAGIPMPPEEESEEEGVSAEGAPGKRALGRIAPMFTMVCLMPYSARWVVPVLLSEYTKSKQQSRCCK